MEIPHFMTGTKTELNNAIDSVLGDMAGVHRQFFQTPRLLDICARKLFIEGSIAHGVSKEAEVIRYWLRELDEGLLLTFKEP